MVGQLKTGHCLPCRKVKIAMPVLPILTQRNRRFEYRQGGSRFGISQAWNILFRIDPRDALGRGILLVG